METAGPRRGISPQRTTLSAGFGALPRETSVGKMVPMLVTIDRVGRVVIPKEIRERLDLEPNTELEVLVEGQDMVLRRVPRAGRRVVEVDGWPVIEAAEGVTITDSDVQRWRDDGQR